VKNIDNEERALRGGSWLGASWNCRASNRGGLVPGARNFNFGFRVVLHRRKA